MEIRHIRQYIHALVCGALLTFGATATGEVFTVDHMLRNEDFGRAVFGPAGRHVYFEHFRAFEDMQDFGRVFVRGQQRSKILVADLEGDAVPRPAFSQEPGDGYRIATLSPDGGRLLYFRVGSSHFMTGIHDFAKGNSVVLKAIPEASVLYVEPVWISDSTLGFATTRDGRLPLGLHLHAEWRDKLYGEWQEARRGRNATSSVIGSGEYLLTGSRQVQGELVLANAQTGNTTTLAGGNFESWEFSPDRRWVAGVRTLPLAPDPKLPLEHAVLGGVRRDLVVIDTEDGSAPVLPCPGCDIAMGTAKWSPDGQSLVFFARLLGEAWSTGKLWRFDLHSNEAEPFELEGLKPVTRAGPLELLLAPQTAWVGDSLAVFATDPEGEPRPEWFIVSSAEETRRLSGEFGESPIQLVAVLGDRLIALADGDVWSIGSDGRRTLLTAGIDYLLKTWQAHDGFGPPPPFAAGYDPRLVLQGDNGDIVFLHGADGTLRSVAAPSERATPIAASFAAGRVLYRDVAENVGVLSACTHGGECRELVRINGHLEGVAVGTPIRIDHEGAEGRQLYSWILMPPGYREGARVPTIVDVYPGGVFRSEWNRFDPWDMHALNRHLLAAQGYAVLFPSLPEAYHEVPRDPLVGLADRILAVVDLAIEAGYADADRLAIQGQSYGGYATLGAIAQTNRFKAAVALAGPVNLISMYGVFDVRMREAAELSGPRLFGASWLETSQGGMGAPPWGDPERYVRNSPLFHAPRIETPVMIMHGDRDFVSITEGEQMFTALLRENKDAVFVRYWGEGHVYNSPANIRDMWSRIFNWYGRYLDADNEER